MARVPITDEKGSWTGAWFDADPDATGVKHYPPNKRRHGMPLQLWRTSKGAWVLVNIQGTEGSNSTETAQVIPEARALMIMHQWGHQLTQTQRDTLIAAEV